MVKILCTIPMFTPCPERLDQLCALRRIWMELDVRSPANLELPGYFSGRFGLLPKAIRSLRKLIHVAVVVGVRSGFLEHHNPYAYR